MSDTVQNCILIVTKSWKSYARYFYLELKLCHLNRFLECSEMFVCVINKLFCKEAWMSSHRMFLRLILATRSSWAWNERWCLPSIVLGARRGQLLFEHCEAWQRKQCVTASNILPLNTPLQYTNKQVNTVLTLFTLFNYNFKKYLFN